MGTNLSKGRNREWLQRDVDRERRLRLDTEARLKGSSSEADRCRAKLSALQKDVAKMEETIRTLLQYKSKFEQLKQDRHSAANSYENQILQLQNAITKLKIENETLKKQINTLEATGISQVQKALVERLRTLEHEKNRIEREGEQQRKQYEKCLDDVAKQVVKAVLSQKGLREEISSLQNRVKELETGNCALSALLVQRLGQKINYSPTTMPVAESRSVMFDIHRSSPMKMSIERPASCDLTKGLKKLKNDGWQAAVSYHRPQSLNLELCCSHNAEESTKCDRVLGDETPESGNRDEGYSTMSSDVQGTTEPPSTKGLEDVKEANENESNALMESSPCSRAMNSEDTDVIFVPLSLSFSFINPRHSYPPLRYLSTGPVQHIMRSYSDSHLFLKLAAATGNGGGGGGVTAGAAGAVVEDEDRTSWYSGGELWDMDYVQHWLRLDETRAAIQQRMEYDAAELEDWTMDDGASWKRISAAAAAAADGKHLQQSLPCIEEDDAAGGMKTAVTAADEDDEDEDSGSARLHMSWHHHYGHHGEDDDLLQHHPLHHHLDDEHLHHRLHNHHDHHHHHHHTHPLQKLHHHHHHPHHHQLQQQQPLQLQPHQQQQPPSSPGYNGTCSGGSPGGDSWSSADEYGAAGTPPSKRSSASYSDSIEMLPPPGPIAGTDFTRDFYRLVKFESSKSLASTSTGGGEHRRPPAVAGEAQLDREQALQSVLDFIAEQQQYCISRQAQDKREPTTATAVDAVVTTPDVVVVDAEPSASVKSMPQQPALQQQQQQQTACDSNSCSDNLLNSKDSGLCGSDVEIECLPDDCYAADLPHDATRSGGGGCSTPRSASTLLRPVPEEDEESSAKSTSPQPSSSCDGGRDCGSSSACTADTAVMVSAWAATASSKDLIDQLIRMTGGGDDDPSGLTASTDFGCDHNDPSHAAATGKRNSSASSTSSQTDLDEACCCPTGWVHVERDIDFADPKERANLLDVMLMASSRSSSSSATAGEDEDDDDDDSSCGSGDVGCCRSSGSVGPEPSGRDTSEDDSSDDERDADDDDDLVARTAGIVVGRRTPSAATAIAACTEHASNEASYNRLHKLHRVRRQKKASAIRDGFGVLRCPTVAAGLRQSIVGRSDFFVRFGDKEREAISNFDFLDDLSSATSASTDSGERAQSPPPATAPATAATVATGHRDDDNGRTGHKNKYYSYTCSSSATTAAAAATSSRLPSDGRRQRRRRYSGLSLSDSCGDSD